MALQYYNVFCLKIIEAYAKEDKRIKAKLLVNQKNRRLTQKKIKESKLL